MHGFLIAALGAGVTPAVVLSLRYRRELKAARARLAAVTRHRISTPWGAVEYAERGSGDPVLVVPGIFQNCVSGLLSVRDILTGRRVIAPSRFGYLGSSMPPDATPAAQADAFAALLDALGIREIDVVALSAGATSALQLGPASSWEGETSRGAGGEPARHPHGGRSAVFSEAVESTPVDLTVFFAERGNHRVERVAS